MLRIGKEVNVNVSPTMNPEDQPDTTIADLHRVRREMAAQFGGDLLALTADAQARAEASGRTILRRGETAKHTIPSVSEAGTPQSHDHPTRAT
jgi:hypothetical protein